MTHVLALDLSLTATGVADTAGDLDTIRPHTKGDQRLTEITTRVTDAIYTSPDRPQLVVIEDLPHGIRNAAAGALGMVHGAVRYQLQSHELPYLTVPPATLKTLATGRGNAKKPDMRMDLFKRTGLDVPDDNQVDAWWLRVLGRLLAGHVVFDTPLPQTHLRALTKLTLPDGVTG